jgi:hypothetical protein
LDPIAPNFQRGRRREAMTAGPAAVRPNRWLISAWYSFRVFDVVFYFNLLNIPSRNNLLLTADIAATIR